MTPERDTDTEPTLPQLVAELAQQTETYNKLRDDLQFQRNAVNTALNSLNRLQQRIDKEIEKLKKDQPNESDWVRQKTQKRQKDQDF